MPKELLDLQLVRHNKQPWGFRLHGGRDEGLVLKVEKVIMEEEFFKIVQLGTGLKCRCTARCTRQIGQCHQISCNFA